MNDDGTVGIAHSEAAGAEEAKRRVEALCQEIVVGNIYEGKVTSASRSSGRSSRSPPAGTGCATSANSTAAS